MAQAVDILNVMSSAIGGLVGALLGVRTWMVRLRKTDGRELAKSMSRGIVSLRLTIEDVRRRGVSRVEYRSSFEQAGLSPDEDIDATRALYTDRLARLRHAWDNVMEPLVNEAEALWGPGVFNDPAARLRALVRRLDTAVTLCKLSMVGDGYEDSVNFTRYEHIAFAPPKNDEFGGAVDEAIEVARRALTRFM